MGAVPSWEFHSGGAKQPLSSAQTSHSRKIQLSIQRSRRHTRSALVMDILGLAEPLRRLVQRPISELPALALLQADVPRYGLLRSADPLANPLIARELSLRNRRDRRFAADESALTAV